MWAAEAPSSSSSSQVIYVALLNYAKQELTVSATFAELGLGNAASKCDVLNLWTGEEESAAGTAGKVSKMLPAITGAELYQLSNCT